MALVDLKSNLANFRSDFKPMDLETRFAKPNSSNINIDSIPEPVSLKSKLAPFSKKLTSSLLNIDDVPGKFSPGEIYRPSRYAIAKIVNASRFNIDNVPGKFSPVGKYTPSKYAEEAKLPDTITRWKGANGKAATAVNYISDSKFGLRGFVTNFTDPNTSQFLGVAGTPLQNKFDYPATIVGNRLMKPAKSAAFPGPQNFIDNIKFGATGFTTNLGKSGLAEKSQFLGISGTPGNKKYSYPGDKLLQGNRLMQPGFGSQQFSKSQYGIEQDFLDNKYASGFTTNMNLGPGVNNEEKSRFKGINHDKHDYTRPGTYIIPAPKSTGIGAPGQPKDASFNRQLGDGSPFKYLKDGALISKIFSVEGYSSSKKYDSVVASIAGQPNKSLLYKKGMEQNSPPAIDAEYKKFNLHNEAITGGAFNPSYINQPYILRGIQRKGNEKPQYWGFGSRSGFDDGLIRGGVVTVADRIVADTVRIAKWMASPKGLLWIVKQIGLGLTNPKVEAIGGPFTRQTRIHTGVASLLSVPGTALGLHFTRHGIPFANEIASYENVSRIKNSLLTYSIADITGVTQPGNRLIGLRKQLGLHTQSGATLIQQGMPILSLSGLAGPQSVYGIGITSIRRSTQTISNRLSDIEERNNINPFSIIAGYSLNRGYKSSIKFPSNQYLRKGGTPRKSLNDLGKGLSTKTTSPGAQLNSIKVDLSTAKSRERVYGSDTVTPTDINNYLTLAYNKIPKDKKSFRDFRRDINIDGIAGGFSSVRNILGTGVLLKDNTVAKPNYETADDKDKFVQHYDKDNLETRYGFGKQGQQGTEIIPSIGKGSFIAAGTQFARNSDKNNNEGRFILARAPGFRGDKITAIDISSNTGAVLPDQKEYDSKGTGKAEDLIKFWFEDGVKGQSVMPFRCTINGLSETFSPGWSPIAIMGRPDGAALYTSFERSISFSFTAAATSRSEMIPMWRKLNYLASYTMPDYNAAGGKPSGPFMRITIGDLYYKCPGYITSLSYTFPDEGSWDIAADFEANDNPDPKQLPMSVEVSVGYTIINDFRPQLMGRVYSLSKYGSNAIEAGNWLSDAEDNIKNPEQPTEPADIKAEGEGPPEKIKK